MEENLIISKQTKKIRTITITSCLLSVSLFTSFITNFIKISFLGSFLTLDISLVFIIPLIFICGFYSSFFTSIIVGAFSIFWSDGSWVGTLVNIFVNIIVVLVISIFKLFLFKKNKQILLKIIIMFVFSLPIICIIISFFNAILFQPLYWWVFGYIKTPSLIEAINKYNSSPNIFLLFINDYWKGTFTLYTIFNSIKLFITFFISICPLNIIIKQRFKEKYFFNLKQIKC